MEQILILEDDIALNQGLCKALKTENRKIVSCETIKAARDQLLCGCPSLAAFIVSQETIFLFSVFNALHKP